MKESRKTADKPKVYFARIKEDVYKDISILAREDERSISYMVNKLLKASLESQKNK